MPDEIEPVLVFAKIALKSDPTSHVPMTRNDAFRRTARRAVLFAGREPLPALCAKWAVGQSSIQGLKRVNDSVPRSLDLARFVPFATPNTMVASAYYLAV